MSKKFFDIRYIVIGRFDRNDDRDIVMNVFCDELSRSTLDILFWKLLNRRRIANENVVRYVRRVTRRGKGQGKEIITLL